ncbi:MAG: hypothetical protein ACO1SX_25675 [Actinomycetota bacterium]
MQKYDVYGTLTIPVRMVVMAESKEEAQEIADDNWQGLKDYVGNGASHGRLIGHSRTGVYIEAGNDAPNWHDVQEAELSNEAPIDLDEE